MTTCSARRKAAATIAALDLTDDEWAYIYRSLNYEHDCNENPTAKSAADKLRPLVVDVLGFKP